MTKMYSISDLAEEIDRTKQTIRNWDRQGRLPERLRPMRVGPKGWRRWSPEQVEGIKQWMQDKRMFSGGGLPHYNPSEKENQ